VLQVDMVKRVPGPFVRLHSASGDRHRLESPPQWS
jgi:hypothetical protein